VEQVREGWRGWMGCKRVVWAGVDFFGGVVVYQSTVFPAFSAFKCQDDCRRVLPPSRLTDFTRNTPAPTHRRTDRREPDLPLDGICSLYTPKACRPDLYARPCRTGGNSLPFWARRWRRGAFLSGRAVRLCDEVRICGCRLGVSWWSEIEWQGEELLPREDMEGSYAVEFEHGMVEKL
jgi:hypothetical protein